MSKPETSHIDTDINCGPDTDDSDSVRAEQLISVKTEPVTEEEAGCEGMFELRGVNIKCEPDSKHVHKTDEDDDSDGNLTVTFCPPSASGGCGGTNLLNRFKPTPPSARQRGGQHGHKRVNAKHDPDTRHVDKSLTPPGATSESGRQVHPADLVLADHVGHAKKGESGLEQQTGSNLHDHLQSEEERLHENVQNSGQFAATDEDQRQLSIPAGTGVNPCNPILPSTLSSGRQDGITRVNDDSLKSRLNCPKDGDVQFSCTLCPSTFLRKAYLTEHMRVHTGERRYACTLCPLAFTRYNILKEHVRTHTGEKPFACSHCSATFSKRSGLKLHLRTHTGEKPYLCPLCPASFVCSSHLLEHRRAHTGVKPYTCSQCPATFTRLSSVRRHTRIHTGEKPFRCPQCPASFAQPENLTRHKKTHTGERPYICDVCERAFTQSNHLKDHMKTHPIVMSRVL